MRLSSFADDLVIYSHETGVNWFGLVSPLSSRSFVSLISPACFVRFSLQVFAIGGSESEADPEVQEADGGAFSSEGEAQLLDGHHRGSHSGHHQRTAISSTNKYAKTQTRTLRYSDTSAVGCRLHSRLFLYSRC